MTVVIIRASARTEVGYWEANPAAYAVGNWQAGRNLGPGHIWDCTHNNGMALLGLGNGTLRLVDMATGRELARLEDPNQQFGDTRFTPDGTRVVAAAADGLRVWDLRLIRERLVAMGLDWDAPRYAAAPSGDRIPLRLQILQNDK